MKATVVFDEKRSIASAVIEKYKKLFDCHAPLDGHTAAKLMGLDTSKFGAERTGVLALEKAGYTSCGYDPICGTSLYS